MKRSHEQMTHSDAPIMPNMVDNVVPIRQNIAQNPNNLNTSTANIAVDDIQEYMPGILITFDIKRGLSVRIGPTNPSTPWWPLSNPQQPRQMSAPVTREQPAVPTAEPMIQTTATKVSGTTITIPKSVIPQQTLNKYQ